MKKLHLVTLLFVGFAVLLSAPCSADWKFSRMIKEIESKIPAAEKQAEIIVKMLNSEKHRTQIQADIDAKKLSIGEVYLYRVLNKLGHPPEDTFISFQSLVGGPPSDSRKGLSILSPDFLIGLSNGKFGYRENGIRKDKTFLKSKENAEKLVSVCQKIVEIQTPVQLAARANLTVKKNMMSRDGDILYLDHTGKLSNNAVKGLLGMFIPVNDLYDEFFYYDMKAGKQYFLDFHPSYHKYLQDEARYMKEIGYAGEFQNIDFDDIIERLDEILAKTALTDDLSDLTGSGSQEQSSGTTTEQSQSQDDGLDIDDLMLPE